MFSTIFCHLKNSPWFIKFRGLSNMRRFLKFLRNNRIGNNSKNKVFFYISLIFRPLFSSFSNRLGETKFTDLSFSVTNLHFSITNLHFSGRLQILREILSSIFNKKDNCPSRDLNQGWLDHKQLSYPLYHTGVMKSQCEFPLYKLLGF